MTSALMLGPCAYNHIEFLYSPQIEQHLSSQILLSNDTHLAFSNKIQHKKVNIQQFELHHLVPSENLSLNDI